MTLSLAYGHQAMNGILGKAGMLIITAAWTRGRYGRGGIPRSPGPGADKEAGWPLLGGIPCCCRGVEPSTA